MRLARNIPTYEELGALIVRDDVQLNSMIRQVLRLLRPERVIGHNKARFGGEHDGGYVHLDEFEGVDTALSFGIRDDIRWDVDVADRGLRVFQFDHTVDDPAPEDDRLVFSKTMIAEQARPGAATLEELVRRHDRGRSTPNMILKMDIENWEWPVIEATSEQALSRFKQITCEMHGFEYFVRQEWRQGFFRALRKLNLLYAPIHIHANNCAEMSVIANVPLPNVIEVTFANRACYQTEPSDETFPGPLDTPCNPRVPDIYLGSFRY